MKRKNGRSKVMLRNGAINLMTMVLIIMVKMLLIMMMMMIANHCTPVVTAAASVPRSVI